MRHALILTEIAVSPRLLRRDNADGVWRHANGDIKADSAIAKGVNVLPDGVVALTKAFLGRVG